MRDVEGTPQERAGEASDEALIVAVQSGDAQALETFYDRYHVLAFSLSSRLLGSTSDAEDVVQEAFVNVWRASNTYRIGRSTPRSWLLSIVHHRSIDKLRSRQSRPVQAELTDDMPLSSSSDVWQEVSASLTGQEVRVALEQLPAEQRETIELAYFRGYSQTQIADQMRVPLGTVKGRMRIGLHRLRTLLDGTQREMGLE